MILAYLSSGRYIYRPMNTPYFPAWRTRLAALGRRTGQHAGAAEVENEFARFLASDLLTPTPSGSGSRKRTYTLRRTFWYFLWQVLQPWTPCRAVVRKVQAELETHKRLIDENSSAFCQARARLPLPLLDKGLQQTAACADRLARDALPDWKRPIKVVDVTSFTTPDTLANRKKYHYPSGQKKGCGFPVMRALAIFSLASGAIQQMVSAACYTAELVMLKPLWSTFLRGDILLGDRAYSGFALLAALSIRGVDVVARLHQCRKLNLRRAERLGSHDWRTVLHKPPQQPPYMSEAEWNALPDVVPVRIIRSKLVVKGFRTKTIWIVTTLLDPELYSATAIAGLYLFRWQIELSFRDLKTTMGMETLRCLSPHMIERELRMFLIAYNCLRSLMAEAAGKHQFPRQRISFKGTMDTIRSFHPVMLRTRSRRGLARLHARVLAILVADSLPLRPGRVEPRAVKKRPKPYPLLTKPRRLFKAIPHKGNPKPCKRPQVILT